MKSLRLSLFLLSFLVVLFLGYQKLNERLEDDGRDELSGEERYRGEGAGARGSFSGEEHEDIASKLKGKARPTTRKHPARKKNERIRTDSGLVYQILREGDGARPGPEDNVKVLYRGYVQGGEEFDRTKAGQPMSFPLRAVIKGWGEGLQLMRVGAKYRFIIPPELAYGEKGAASKIGPNKTLVFEVELVGINE